MTTQPTDERVEKVVKEFEQKMELYDMGIGLEVLMFDWLRTQLTTLLADCEARAVDENTSDGYHTFKELYKFRLLYNAALFNEWAKQ